MAERKKVVVLGGGIGGLAAGYFIAERCNYEVTVLERAPVVGGLCASFEYDGFVLDHGAHKLYSVIPGILDEAQALMGDRLLKVSKKNRLYLQGHLVDYPIRLGNLARALGLSVLFKLGMGYAWQFVRGFFPKRPAHSYEEYMVQRFGRPAYKLVFEPLADKVWGNPAELHQELARARVPSSSGLEVILKILGLKKERADTNAEFFYYPRKGFGDWPQALREQIEAKGGNVVVNAQIQGLEQEGGKVTSVNGAVDGHPFSFPCDYLVSSIPLPVLGKLIFSTNDNEFNRAVEGLQFRHLILVYIFVKRPLVLEDQWLFFPERQFIFNRIFEQKQMSPELGPKDRTAICCDFTCTEESWQWQATDEELAKKCEEGLIAAGFIQKGESEGHLVKRRRNFYPRYDLQYVEKVQMVSRKLQQVENLLLTGRIGMYNYNNSDHCADMGRFIAEGLKSGKPPRQIWDELEKRVSTYKIVD